MDSPKYLLDSGPLVAAFNRRDSHHEWAASVLSSLTEPPVTCESVVTVACWHLRQSISAVVRILEMPSMGHLRINPILETDGSRVAAKIAAFGGNMDLADACLVRLSEIYPRAQVITIDRGHFGVYRRFRNQPIPLVLPRN